MNSFEQSLAGIPGAAAAYQNAAPGKTTKTQGLAGKPPYCEDSPPPVAVCELTPMERLSKKTDLVQVVGSAMANMRTAIQDERITKLTKKASDLGPLGLLLLAGGAGVVVGAVVGGLLAVAEYAKYAKPIGSLLTSATKLATASFQSSASKSDVAGQVRFLELVDETIKPLSDNIVLNALSLDDAELDALVSTYQNPDLHSTAAYRTLMHGLLDRYDAFHLDDVGEVGERDVTGIAWGFQEGMGGLDSKPPPLFRKGELAWVTIHGQRKMTMLEDYGLQHWYSKHRKELVPVLKDGGPLWIPEDLQDYAVSLYNERQGKEPAELDLDAAQAQTGDLGEVFARFAGGAYVDRMFLGMAGAH